MPYVLKECAETSDRPLELSKKLVEEGSIPKNLKRANVVLISKKGDRENTLNYRPVSLMSTVCKMLERITKKIIG